MIKYFFVLCFLISCNSDCPNRNIAINYLIDINQLVKDNYRCKNHLFNDFGNEDLKDYKVVFSDKRYEVVYNNNKVRLFFDKEKDMRLAIVSAGPELIRNSLRPNSLYVLDEKLMPIYSISLLERKHRVFKYEYIKGVVNTKIATNKESMGINIDNIPYDDLLSLIKSMDTSFTFVNTKWSDSVYYNIPLWVDENR